MKPSSRANERVLETLTARVRLGVGDDLLRLGASRRGLERLRAEGLLVRCSAILALVPVADPAIRWRVGEPEPDFGPAAYRIRRRWELSIPRPVILWAATPRAERLVGGRAPHLRPGQLQHDAHVSLVYFSHYLGDSRWIGEDAAEPDGRSGKRPDAVLADADGAPERLIEFGGSYPAERLVEFHRFAESLGIDYDLY
jgi:hypothetical protein